MIFFKTQNQRKSESKTNSTGCVEIFYHHSDFPPPFELTLRCTFYCRTLVLMSVPAALRPLCGRCWLVVQSHRHFITNQSLFALPHKYRYCTYHGATCLHLVTQVTLSCFVCTLLMFFANSRPSQRPLCKHETFIFARRQVFLRKMS